MEFCVSATQNLSPHLVRFAILPVYVPTAAAAERCFIKERLHSQTLKTLRLVHWQFIGNSAIHRPLVQLLISFRVYFTWRMKITFRIFIHGREDAYAFIIWTGVERMTTNIYLLVRHRIVEWVWRVYNSFAPSTIHFYIIFVNIFSCTFKCCNV